MTLLSGQFADLPYYGIKRNKIVFKKANVSLHQLFISTLILQVKAEIAAKMEHLKKDLMITEVKYKIICKDAEDYLKMAQDLASLMSAKGF